MRGIVPAGKGNRVATEHCRFESDFSAPEESELRVMVLATLDLLGCASEWCRGRSADGVSDCSHETKLAQGQSRRRLSVRPRPLAIRSREGAGFFSRKTT